MRRSCLRRDLMARTGSTNSSWASTPMPSMSVDRVAFREILLSLAIEN
jgi:hypothetical protein